VAIRRAQAPSKPLSSRKNTNTPTTAAARPYADLGKKRQLALREHGLGLDALTGFVAEQPLWGVHQAVFAVLALESEPVDPRL
jgi:hypothetical protein